MKNKKSLAMIDALIWIGLGIFIFFILAIIGPRLLGKEATDISNSLSLTKDYDGDSVVDFYDKCVCMPGDEKNDGCPIGMETKGEAAIKRENQCKKKIADNK